MVPDWKWTRPFPRPTAAPSSIYIQIQKFCTTSSSDGCLVQTQRCPQISINSLLSSSGHLKYQTDKGMTNNVISALCVAPSALWTVCIGKLSCYEGTVFCLICSMNKSENTSKHKCPGVTLHKRGKVIQEVINVASLDIMAFGWWNIGL